MNMFARVLSNETAKSADSSCFGGYGPPRHHLCGKGQS